MTKRNDVAILGVGEAITANIDFLLENPTSLRKLLTELLAEPLNEATLQKGTYRLTAMITLHKEPENEAAPPSDD